MSFIPPGREGWWFHLVVSTRPQWGSTGTQTGNSFPGPQLLRTSLQPITVPTCSQDPYLRDKLSVCTSYSLVQLFSCWRLIFIASQHPDNAIFSLNHKGSSQESLPIYLFATMTGFLRRIVRKLCVQDDICGSFCCFFFFKQLIYGQGASSSWVRLLKQPREKRVLLLGALMLSQESYFYPVALLTHQHRNLRTITLLHWLLSPLQQGQSSINDWFKHIFLDAWNCNRNNSSFSFQ